MTHTKYFLKKIGNLRKKLKNPCPTKLILLFRDISIYGFL
jgi:hypothetical protein